MSWEVVTSYTLNGIPTTWTMTNEAIANAKAFSRATIGGQPASVACVCTNALCYIPCNPNDPTVFDIDFGNGLHFKRQSDEMCLLVLNGETLATLTLQGNGDNNDESVGAFMIDAENERATFMNYRSWYSWRWEGSWRFYPDNDPTLYDSMHKLYNWYMGVTPYNWQSVPSISGKNGILQSLVQIKEEALNDGEPVSEATVLSFDSLGNINIPSVIDEQMPVDPSDVTSVTATYLIPALEDGTYEGIKLLVKKGSIPTSEEDADKVVNLDEPTSILRIDSKSVGNLDEDSHYYFVVKLVDEIGTEATSDPKDIWTSHSEGWTFDYTGEIQTFVAPKTGIYQLETWGAQGGNATDGTNSARGGYGAYAVGEVFLTQGDTLYINVGGQNGYGGGGKNVGIECVPQIVIDGNIVNLLTINDFSVIPSGLSDVVITRANEAKIFDSDLVSFDKVPDYLVSNGDLFIEVGASIDYTEKELSIKNNNTVLKVICPYNNNDNTAGLKIMVDNIMLTNLGHRKTGDYTRKIYMGIILDHINSVGYILLFGKYHNSNQYKNVLWIAGGKYNGIDIVYEAFKNAGP